MFQGSEEKTVVYVVGNSGRQHWQHVYTAVTRGRCRVYIIAEEPHLRKAVTNKNVPRKTRLQRFLREAIAETSNGPKQTSSPLTKGRQSQELETRSVSVTRGAPGPSEPLTDLKQEGSAVLNREEQTGNVQQSPCKRQPEDSEDAMKAPSVSTSLLRKFKTNFCTLFHCCKSPGYSYGCFIITCLIIFRMTSNGWSSQVWQMFSQSNIWLIGKNKLCQ